MTKLTKNGKRVGCFIIHEMYGTCAGDNTLSYYMKEQGYITYCCTPATCYNSCDAMNPNIYYEWLHFAEKELAHFVNECYTVVVIGYSIGGLIGIHLAEKYRVDALITINAPIYISDFRGLVGMLQYEPEKKSHSNVNRVVISTLYNLLNFKKLVNQAKRKLSKLHCPLLVIQSKKVKIINWSSAHYIFENVCSREKEIQFFPKSGHYILCDSERQLVFIRVHQFIEKAMESKLMVEGYI
ncbi:MAG: hypothetical protein GX860_10905 [Alcaligenaceae bacterium]|nr:hypothetical protein [Alcaligenaceae bacterium]